MHVYHYLKRWVCRFFQKRNLPKWTRGWPSLPRALMCPWDSFLQNCVWQQARVQGSFHISAPDRSLVPKLSQSWNFWSRVSTIKIFCVFRKHTILIHLKLICGKVQSSFVFMYKWRLKWSEVIESGGRSGQVATGENVAHKNQLLAKRVQTLWTEVSARRKVELKWVQGHTGDTGNEAWIHRVGCSMLQLGFSESKIWQGHARPQSREWGHRFFPSDLIRSLQIGLLMMELQAWSRDSPRAQDFYSILNDC